MTVRFGILGAGVIADVRMAPAMREAVGCELVAVHARNPDKARAFATRHALGRWYSDWQALLEDQEVDAVYVATPPYEHEAQTLAAARAGKHVLCEKPMAITLDECDRMIAACREARVRLGLCFMMRFHPVHRRMRQLLDEGFLGEPRMAEARLLFELGDKSPAAFRVRPELGGGGAVMDVGVHCVDLLRFLLGREVESVSATADRDPAVYPSDLTTMMALRFSGAVPAAVGSSFAIPYAGRNNVELYGSAGSLFSVSTLGQESRGTLIGTSAAGRWVEEPPVYNQYVALLDEFVTAIAEEREPSPGGEDGRAAQAVALAAYESIRSGAVVPLG
ncbi:MAG TPA: Gfo/Idh/MocA family oxidoreductase [Ardenticatenaceae bacterium]|nr:Gfo/Idh/MocA family oxidoreductase [Ardenticatenaceae bacterium]